MLQIYKSFKRHNTNFCRVSVKLIVLIVHKLPIGWRYNCCCFSCTVFCLQQISSLLSNITAASAVNFLIIHGTADGECDSLYRCRRWSRDVPPLFTESVTFHASEKFLGLFDWKLSRLHTEVLRGGSGLFCSCEVWYEGFLCPVFRTM